MDDKTCAGHNCNSWMQELGFTFVGEVRRKPCLTFAGPNMNTEDNNNHACTLKLQWREERLKQKKKIHEGVGNIKQEMVLHSPYFVTNYFWPYLGSLKIVVGDDLS